MIQTFKTDLEKASFVLTMDDIYCEEVGDMLYVNISDSRSVAIHEEEIEHLVNEYEQIINELNH